MTERAAQQWELPVAGYEVVDIWFSGQLYVIAQGGTDPGDPRSRVRGRLQIALGGRFVYQAQDGRSYSLDASGAWEALTPVLALRHAHISAARADARGSLRVRFTSGAMLSADPDPNYESWETSGPGPINLYSPVGGGDPRISVDNSLREV